MRELYIQCDKSATEATERRQSLEVRWLLSARFSLSYLNSIDFSTPFTSKESSERQSEEHKVGCHATLRPKKIRWKSWNLSFSLSSLLFPLSRIQSCLTLLSFCKEAIIFLLQIIIKEASISLIQFPKDVSNHESSRHH